MLILQILKILKSIREKIEVIRKEIKRRKYEKMVALVKKKAIEAGISTLFDVFKKGLAVLKAESKLNPRAYCFNYDKYGVLHSIDRGIAQFNDYYYWKKEKIISPLDALNPKKALKVFWQYFPKRPNDWESYKNGSYKQYL